MDNSHKKIDLLVIVPPTDMVKTIYPPYGAMYIASALRQKGLAPEILNVDMERISNFEVVERIRSIDPKYIGFSGIVSPSYGYIKKLSWELKRAFPEKIQILGGGLAAAYEPIFQNTPIDLIVKGEGDITIQELLQCLENNGELRKVAGIYFRQGGSYHFTGNRKLIANLDSLPYPAFDLVEMDKYLPDGLEFMSKWGRQNGLDQKKLDPNKRKMLTLPTTRGCFAQCSFCFRASAGLRLFSLKYVFDLLEYYMDRFGVGFISFGDECFAPNKVRIWEFIEEYKRRQLNIPFRIFGMRVDTVDRDILRALKEIGCWMICYGFESGSQKMLNIIDKRVTVEQNRQIAKWTQEAGIYTSPGLLLGMPGETDQTIKETIEFMRSLELDFWQYQFSYALPIPGSPLYDFARISGAITNEDEYLESLRGDVSVAGIPHVNLTDVPDEILMGWLKRVSFDLDSHHYLKTGRQPWLIKSLVILGKIKWLASKKRLWPWIKGRLFKKLISIPKALRFRKREDLIFEELIYGQDNSGINTELALKKINERLCRM